MTAPYAQRAIRVSFQLGKGSFGGTGFDTITHDGLRVIAEIQYANLPQQGTGQFRKFGLTLSEMNQLTVAGLAWQARDNKILVEAGDVGGQLSPVFNGSIVEAYPNFRSMPGTFFFVSAVGGAGINVKPVAPTSFKGSVPVETALTTICGKAGLTLENNGVDAVLSNPYFPSTAIPQINSALRAASISESARSSRITRFTALRSNNHRRTDSRRRRHGGRDCVRGSNDFRNPTVILAALRDLPVGTRVSRLSPAFG